MEQINNDQTIKEVSKILGYQVEHKPELDTSKIILTAECNPKELRRTNFISEITSTATGTSTVYTLPTDKDFYLTGFVFSTADDAASDNVQHYVDCVPHNSTSVKLCTIQKITLTAQNSTIVKDIIPPIRLKKGSLIRHSNTFTVGSSRKSTTIYGYTVEPAESTE